MADRVVVEELGEAKCCQGRMYSTETKSQDGGTQVTRHATHILGCKLENIPEPVAEKPPEPKAAPKKAVAKKK